MVVCVGTPRWAGSWELSGNAGEGGSDPSSRSLCPWLSPGLPKWQAPPASQAGGCGWRSQPCCTGMASVGVCCRTGTLRDPENPSDPVSCSTVTSWCLDDEWQCFSMLQGSRATAICAIKLMQSLAEHEIKKRKRRNLFNLRLPAYRCKRHLLAKKPPPLSRYKQYLNWLILMDVYNLVR